MCEYLECYSLNVIYISTRIAVLSVVIPFVLSVSANIKLSMIGNVPQTQLEQI